MAIATNNQKEIQQAYKKWIASWKTREQVISAMKNRLKQTWQYDKLKQDFQAWDVIKQEQSLNKINEPIWAEKIWLWTEKKAVVWDIKSTYQKWITSWLSKEEVIAQMKKRLQETWQYEATKDILTQPASLNIPKDTQTLIEWETKRLWRPLTDAEKLELQQTWTPIWIKWKEWWVSWAVTETPTWTTWVTELTWTETTWVTETPTWEFKTLKDQLTETLAWKMTEEEKLLKAREDLWRWDLEKQRDLFRKEALNIQTDLENISKWLEAEWWAITSIAASRIREARSAPLRDQLTSLVKWIELTSASIWELDKSIEAILKAREIDRQNEVNNLTAQIEGSSLSTEQKNQLLTQLWVQTSRMKQEEEFQAFAQKELFKKQIEKADEESLAKTGLTAQQALESNKIITDLKVKEDSIAWQAVRSLLKEWKTPQEIRKIIWLAEKDEFWVIDDTQFDRQEKLRKEFEASATVKNYLDATQQFAWIVSTLWTKTWPWDIAWIFQFMKSLDPSSVVRETEFAAAAESSWVVDRATSLQILERLNSWQILTPKQREQFVQISKTLFENRKKAFDSKAKQYIRLAKEAWINPKSVVLDWENIPWSATSITEEDLLPLNKYSSAEEWANYYNNKKNAITSDLDDESLGSYLDTGGFNVADQTASSKVYWPVQEVNTPPPTEFWFDFIKKKEWFRDKAYWDVNWWAIWYWQHNINWKPVKEWDTIDIAKAEDDFNNRVKNARFNWLISVDLNENQRAALYDLEHNVWRWVWWFPNGKKIIDLVNKKDFNWAAKVLATSWIWTTNAKTWKVMQWLVNRRKQASELLKLNT